MAVGADGTVYFGTGRGRGAWSNAAYLFAIDRAGRLKWKQRITGGTVTSPVIAADGTVYVATYDGHLYAFR